MSTNTGHIAKINQAKKKVLAIGVSHYSNLQSLDLCANDAEELLRILSKQGYEIPQNRRLIGEVPSEMLKQAIYGFFNDSSREDTLIFYFSGHGLPDGLGKHYLAPSDIDPNNPLLKGLDFDTLEFLINKKCNSDRVIAILDCCFSGAAGLEEMKGEDDISIAKAAREAMELRMKASRGRCILASSLSDQQSLIKKDLGHSLFTYHLLEGLKGKERYVNEYGYVTADCLSNYVFDKMLEEPKRPQIPIRKLQASGELVVTYHPHLARREPEKIHATASPAIADISAIIDEGLEYIKYEEYENALECFNKAIAISPNNYVPYKNKGDILFKLGNNEEAIKAYDEAIAVRPEHPDAYNLKGDVYFKLEEYLKALECYDEAWKIKPNSFEFLKDKGLAHYYLKEYGQAVEFLGKALDLKPGQKMILEIRREAMLKLQEIDELKKGISLYDSGSYEEAVQFFKRSLEASSKNAKTLYYKGLALTHLSKYKEAIECFDEALNVQPIYDEAVKAKDVAQDMQTREETSLKIDEGFYYVKNRDYRSAIDSFDKAIKLNPKSYVPYYHKGDVLLKLEEYDRANECYTRTLEIKPDYYYAWYRKGEVFDEKGDDVVSSEPSKSIEYYGEADSCYDEALKLDQNRSEAWYCKGVVLKKINKISKSESRNEEIECFDKALKIRPDFAEAYYGKGQALADLEKYEEAIECFKAALKIKPMYDDAHKAKESAEYKIAEAHYMHGQTLSGSMKYKEAIECFDKALKIKPRYVDAIKAKEAAHEKQEEKEISLILDEGLRYFEQGDYDNAITSFDNVIAANPKNAIAHYHKGNVYSKKKEYKQASECYNRTLAINPKYFDALRDNGLAIYELGDYKGAIECYDKALELNPNQSTILQYKKQALLMIEGTAKKKISHGAIIGIDIGTSNSAAAALIDGKLIIIPAAEGSSLGAKSFPSVVTITQDSKIVVGEPAIRKMISIPEAAVIESKRKMGTDFRFNVFGKEYSPQQISAFILQKIKNDAEALLGRTVDRAVITVPAYFNENQRQATRDAAKIAGLLAVRLINEPTAASLAYGLHKIQNDLRFMVFDLGSRSLDIAIVKMGGGVFQVTSYASDTLLGGTDMDNKLVDYILQEFKNQSGLDVRNDRTAMMRVREATEKAKIELSNVVNTEINIPFLTYDSATGPKNLVLQITRAKMEELLRPIIERCKGPTMQALQDAKLGPNDIDKIILIGGPTRMPMVRQFVATIMGKEPERGVDPMEAVAIGAAIQGAAISGDVSTDILLVDVTPLTLGVEVLGGLKEAIIERNTTIPTKKSKIFTTAADNQTTVTIHVVQGERAMAADCVSLGMFNLSGIPPAPRGVPQIEVIFDNDANGILNVTAKDLATSKASHLIMFRGEVKIKQLPVTYEVNERVSKASDPKKTFWGLKHNRQNIERVSKASDPKKTFWGLKHNRQNIERS